MDSFEDIRIPVVEDNLMLLNFLMAFMMLSVALDMKWSDFREVLRSPRKVLIGLSSQIILLPILTILLIWVWQPVASIAMGLLLIASVPGGNLSNYTVHMGKGNTALSVMMTTTITIAAVILTPVIFTGLSWLLEWLQISGGTGKDLSVPFSKIVETIVILIAIPLALGMSLAHRFPDFVKRIRKPVKIISLGIFLLFIVGALYGNRENISHHIQHVFWLVILHNLAALLIGYQYARRIWRLDVADCKAISIETGIQNGGLALILIFNFFPEVGGMALVAAWWGVWDMISALLLGLWWGRRSRNIITTEVTD